LAKIKGYKEKFGLLPGFDVPLTNYPCAELLMRRWMFR